MLDLSNAIHWYVNAMSTFLSLQFCHFYILHVPNLLLITHCNGRPMPSSEPKSLKLTELFFQPCCVYLYSKYSPAVSPGGRCQWEVFVICGHWSAAPQLHDVWLGLIECSAAEILSVFCLCSANRCLLATSSPPLTTYVLGTGGWVSGELL